MDKNIKEVKLRANLSSKQLNFYLEEKQEYEYNKPPEIIEINS